MEPLTGEVFRMPHETELGDTHTILLQKRSMRARWLDISNLKRDDGNAGTQEFAGQKCSYI